MIFHCIDIYSLFIHLSVNGCLGYFYFCLCCFDMHVYAYIFLFLGIYLGVEVLGHMVTVCLLSLEIARPKHPSYLKF